MLDKQQIVALLKAFSVKHNVPLADVGILGGAAMVLWGIREHALDIDLYAPTAVCERLATEAVDLIFDIKDVEYETEPSEGLNLQTPESLINMKLRVGRPKDLTDVELIRAWYY